MILPTVGVVAALWVSVARLLNSTEALTILKRANGQLGPAPERFGEHPRADDFPDAVFYGKATRCRFRNSLSATL